MNHLVKLTMAFLMAALPVQLAVCACCTSSPEPVVDAHSTCCLDGEGAGEEAPHHENTPTHPASCPCPAHSLDVAACCDLSVELAATFVPRPIELPLHDAVPGDDNLHNAHHAAHDVRIGGARSSPPTCGVPILLERLLL